MSVNFFNILLNNINTKTEIALAPDYSGCSIISIMKIINNKKRKLKLIGVPTLGFQADILIGAGCVESIECAAVNIAEFGPGPRFNEAFYNQKLTVIDSTCPAIHNGLQASEKGIPYMPIRGIIGSDLLEKNKNWKVKNNPFEIEDPIVLVKAIKPDISIFHAPIADKFGNVWIGKRRELMTMAHASKKTFVTYEKEFDGNLLRDKYMSPGTISSIYISNLLFFPNGAWPVGLFGSYPMDKEEINKYLIHSKTKNGFKKYVKDLKCKFFKE